MQGRTGAYAGSKDAHHGLLEGGQLDRWYSRRMSSLQDELGEVCRRFGVVSLYVFGSRAQEVAARAAGRQEIQGPTGSDLDVAVEPAEGSLRDPRDRVLLMQRLEALFDVARVDLVILPEADPFLAADAIRGELLHCDDENRQAREELYYLRRAGDLAPFKRARLEGILSGELRR